MKTVSKIGGLALVVALSSTAQATLLAPNTYTPGIAPGVQGASGTVVGAFNYNFAATQGSKSLAGVFHSWVVSGDSANSFGGLSFYYQVDISTTSPADLKLYRVTTSGFDITPGANVDANYIVGGVAPAKVDRNAETTIGWNFTPGMVAGQSSATLVIHTPWTTWQKGNGTVSDGITANATILAPAAVPEATSIIAGALMLLPFGFQGFRMIRTRKS